MKEKTLIRLSSIGLALLVVAGLSSCESTAGNTKTIKHHPHQHNVAR